MSPAAHKQGTCECAWGEPRETRPLAHVVSTPHSFVWNQQNLISRTNQPSALLKEYDLHLTYISVVFGAFVIIYMWVRIRNKMTFYFGRFEFDFHHPFALWPF